LKGCLKDILLSNYIIGNLNGKVGKVPKNGVMGAFGVPDENVNGRRIKDTCNARDLYVTNCFLKHKDVHNYAWYRVNNDIIQRILID